MLSHMLPAVAQSIETKLGHRFVQVQRGPVDMELGLTAVDFRGSPPGHCRGAPLANHTPTARGGVLCDRPTSDICTHQWSL